MLIKYSIYFNYFIGLTKIKILFKLEIYMIYFTFIVLYSNININ